MKKSDITKTKILESAEQEFAEMGLYGARVDSIAQNAGVNKRMIYEHFGSKEKLYSTVLTAVYARLADSEAELLSAGESCVETIRALIKRYFELLRENTTFIRMVMWENLTGAQYLKNSNAPTVKGKALTLLREALETGIKEGVFREDIDISEIMLSMNLFCFSYFSNVHSMPHVLNVEFEDDELLNKRSSAVADMILGYIMKK